MNPYDAILNNQNSDILGNQQMSTQDQVAIMNANKEMEKESENAQKVDDGTQDKNQIQEQ